MLIENVLNILPFRIIRLGYQCAEDLFFNFKRKYLPFAEVARPQASIQTHLRCTMEWLKLSVEVTRDGGSSGGFSYVQGWRKFFPETTGYLSKTFIEYASFANDPVYREEAKRMLDFLSTIQSEDGGISQGLYQKDRRRVSTVFDTGMVMLGWLAGYRATKKHTYLQSLIKAGDFLCRISEPEQLWLHHSYNNIHHTYHTRVAWPLLDLSVLTGEDKYKKKAEGIYGWALEQQADNGYFKNCSFSANRPTYNTHAFAYTIRGFLEGYLIQENLTYFNAAKKASDIFMKKFEINKALVTLFNEKWEPESKTECLTGIAQHSIIWFKFYQITGDIRYLNAALDATDLLCAIQDINSIFSEIRGAIKGSHPIWGRYASLAYPNWAGKFFADALILRIKTTKNLQAKFL